TNPLLKFLGQLMCAVTLIVSGIIINISDYYALNALFTIFWVVGIMNSINMLDNMDGITASVSGIILLTCLVILMIQGSLFSIYSFIIIGVIGAIGGFMVFNFHPSKIYMGDTGSQFLGVLLSGLGIIILWSKDFRDVPGPAFQFKQFLFPVLVFCIPIIDTATVVIRRLLRRQSPFVGGRDHTTHHLAYLGLSDRIVLLVLCLIALLSSAIVCVLIYFYQYMESEFTLMCFAYFIILFNVMQYLYELGNKRKKQIEENQKSMKVA
ncbi:MAG: MraY family glycosyltransferase, partial [Bacteroidota bacterium]